MEYCILCDEEAVKVIPQTGAGLCESHAEAYEMGQSEIDDAHIPSSRILEPIDG